MQWISSLLFGVSSSLDAFLIGISLGLRHVRLKCSQNLFISLIALLGTCLSVGLGKFLSPILPAWIAVYLGSLALILLGFYYIVKWLKKLFSKKASADTPSFQSLFALSVALSANNIGMGLAASLGGLSLPHAAVSTFLCSFLLLFTGNCLGKSHVFLFLGSLTEPLSGLLLIGLGLFQLFS